MARSNSSHEGTFEDETGSSERSDEDVLSSEGESDVEESDVEESDVDEVPISKSVLPFDQKVELFNGGGKKDLPAAESEEEYSGSEEEYSEGGSEIFDNEVDSDDSEESESSGDESSSEDGSSGSESEGSESGERDDEDNFMNEQERLRGMGGLASSDRSRKMYVIGLAVFCVVLLAVAIGLGVGLSNKKDDKKFSDGNGSLAPSMPPAAMEPTNPPVRMPISLPNVPKLGAIVDVEVVIQSPYDTTIYRSGELSEIAYESRPNEDTMLVQNMLVEDGAQFPELPMAFSLIELPVNLDEVQYLLNDDSFKATFCLQHVPNEEQSDRVATYYACLLRDDSAEDVDLAEVITRYSTPQNCEGDAVPFKVSPTDTEICMDVTSMVLTFLRNVRLGGGLRGRSLQDSQKDIIMLLDKRDPSNEPGDRFYSTNNVVSKNPPSLTIEGTEIADCTTIVDIVCSDSRLSLLCNFVKEYGLGVMLGDNRSSLTLFAPTDEAISKVLEDIGDVDVKYVLLYHVVYLELRSVDIDCSLPKIPPLQMANFESTTVECVSDAIFVVGSGNGELPKIIEADITTCNGVIHVIDEVILPGFFSSSEDIPEYSVTCPDQDYKDYCDCGYDCTDNPAFCSCDEAQGPTCCGRADDFSSSGDGSDLQ